MTETVGFVGVGIMGKPMVMNLLGAGYEVVAHSRSAGSVDEVVAAGAKRGESPAEVAGRVDVVITMLPDTPDVEAVLVSGPDPVVDGVRAGQLVIDMSSISPGATRKLAAVFAAKAVGFLDAPVSGGEKGAIEGALSIMVGGRQEDFARAMPIFEVLGKSIVLVGPSGAGQVTKACNQLVVAANIEAVAEALVLAAKAGVDPAKVREALLGGFAGSKILEVHGQRMLAGTFDPGFRIRLHRKDARIIEETAAELGVPTPAFERVVEQLQRLVDSGGGELDHSALVTVLEEDAGVQVRSAAGAD
ncbi:MAG: 2-hydroxy-3-oxopropionate reductase [Actinomycetota bacterium]